MAKKKAAPVKEAPAPPPHDENDVKVYLDGQQDEHGAFHPMFLGAKARQYFVDYAGARYYHVGEASDGTWIYRKER